MSEGEFQRLLDDEALPFRVELCMALSVFLRWRFFPAFLKWFLCFVCIILGAYVIAVLFFISAVSALFAGLFYSLTLTNVELEKRKVKMGEELGVAQVDLSVLKCNNKNKKSFMRKVDFECLRCARCCQGYITMVPVYKDSDLSPRYLTAYLKEFGFLKLLKYLKTHAGFAGKQCLWLSFDSEGKAFCKCHPKRSIYCSRHTPFNRVSLKCVVGKKTLKLGERK